MKILNDQIIVSNLQSNGLWGTQYNYYVYATMMAGSNVYGLGPVVATLAAKYYILNFNEQGLGVLGLGLGGNVIDGHVQMLPYSKIKQLTIKSKLITLGLALNLQIILTDNNDTLNMQVSRSVPTIKQQGPNLQNIRNLFSNGVPQSVQSTTSPQQQVSPIVQEPTSNNQK
ncbi:MAG TPA: hypothetical protein VIH90_03720 [Candidatus Saccharimonadales bacterium]